MFNFKSDKNTGPLPNVTNNRVHLVILLAGAATLIVLSAVVGYFFGRSEIEDLERENSVTTGVNGSLGAPCNVGEVLENGVCTSVSDVLSSTSTEEQIVTSTVQAQYENLPADILKNVSWQWPDKTNKLGFYLRASDENQANYYKVGTFSRAGSVGTVYFMKGVGYDMGLSQDAYLISFNSKLYYVSKASHKVGEPEMYVPNYANFYVDKTLNIPAWDFPQSFTYGGAKFIREGFEGYLGEPARPYPLVWLKEDMAKTVEPKYKKVFVIAKWGDVYEDVQNGSHKIIAPDGTVAIYVVDVPFITSENVAKVTWNDGDHTSHSFTSYQDSGCSGYGTVAVERNLSETDLVEIGKASSGDEVYGLKDINHELLKRAYESSFYPSEGKNISYDEYVKSKPLVFWKDPLGRWIRLKNLKFKPPVECGKPVIYLYPEKETKINVKLDLLKVTYSDPLYQNGWEVVAKPNGELKEVKSGNVYPYLFWEGLGSGRYLMPEEGYVVKKEEVKGMLEEKLGVMGLNEREKADFMEFWYPKMQTSPYYLIKFMGTRAMEELAPLTVQPKPDTVIRVFMEFEGLERPVDVKEPTLRTPKRNGFTVVEWGGLLK